MLAIYVDDKNDIAAVKISSCDKTNIINELYNQKIIRPVPKYNKIYIFVDEKKHSTIYLSDSEKEAWKEKAGYYDCY